jgi:hypothetical protein
LVALSTVIAAERSTSAVCPALEPVVDDADSLGTPEGDSAGVGDGERAVVTGAAGGIPGLVPPADGEPP